MQFKIIYFIKNFIKSLSQILIEQIYPPRCVVCDGLLKWGEYGIHTECKKELFLVNGSTCIHCGRPLSSNVSEYCYDCGRKDLTLSFKQGKALFWYKGAIKRSMYKFKYANKREYGDFYAQVALEVYGEWMLKHNIQCIVPVPMYGKKKKSRGYNQAEVFAKALSEKTGIPTDAKCLKRIKNTIPMKNLNDIERKNNLKNAFQLNENIVQYTYIMIVDDIYTTGSTADAICEELLRAGVEEVYFLSICIGEGY